MKSQKQYKKYDSNYHYHYLKKDPLQYLANQKYSITKKTSSKSKENKYIQNSQNQKEKLISTSILTYGVKSINKSFQKQYQQSKSVNKNQNYKKHEINFNKINESQSYCIQNGRNRTISTLNNTFHWIKPSIKQQNHQIRLAEKECKKDVKQTYKFTKALIKIQNQKHQKQKTSDKNSRSLKKINITQQINPRKENVNPNINKNKDQSILTSYNKMSKKMPLKNKQQVKKSISSKILSLQIKTNSKNVHLQYNNSSSSLTINTKKQHIEPQFHKIKNKILQNKSQIKKNKIQPENNNKNFNEKRNLKLFSNLSIASIENFDENEIECKNTRQQQISNSLQTKSKLKLSLSRKELIQIKQKQKQKQKEYQQSKEKQKTIDEFQRVNQLKQSNQKIIQTSYQNITINNQLFSPSVLNSAYYFATTQSSKIKNNQINTNQFFLQQEREQDNFLKQEKYKKETKIQRLSLDHQSGKVVKIIQNAPDSQTPKNKIEVIKSKHSPLRSIKKLQNSNLKIIQQGNTQKGEEIQNKYSNLFPKIIKIGIQNFIILSKQKEKCQNECNYFKIAKYRAIYKPLNFLCCLSIIQKKQFKKDSLFKEQFLSSLLIRIRQNFRCSNLIQLYHVFQDEKNVYLIQQQLNYSIKEDNILNSGDQIPKSSLKKIDQSKQIKILSQKDACFIFKQILDAYLHLHSEQIIHRALKIQNIKFSDFGVCKISNFEWIAKLQKNKNRQTFCGQIYLASPEVLIGMSYDQSIDVWQLGILLYKLLTGSHPFSQTNTQKDKNYEELNQKTIKNIEKMNIKFSKILTNQAIDLFGQIFEQKQNRILLKNIIQHPLMTKYQYDFSVSKQIWNFCK